MGRQCGQRWAIIMIKASKALAVWLREQNIDPTSVRLTLSAHPVVADRIGRAIAGMKADMLPLGSSDDSIREGHIFGIRFNVVDDR